MAIQKPKDAKPKIAILSRNFSKGAGGAENYAVNLAEQLADEFEFHVFCERSDVSHPAITIHCMGRNITRPRWIALWLFAWWSWRQTRQGFAIVHSHENTWHGDVQTVHVRPMRHNILSRAISPLAKLLVFVKIFTSPRLLAHLWLEGLRFRGGHERVIVAVAPALAEIISATYRVDTSRLRILTPGVKLACATGSGGVQVLSKTDARKALGLPVHGWVLLLIGHNFEKKGLAAVLRGLPSLPEDVTLLVVGGSVKQAETWRWRCAQKRLDGRVVFAGSLTDVAPAFTAADCLVHATLDDTFGMVALEAMVANVPVILSVSPYCLYADVVHQARAAWMLQNPHSEQDIANGVTTLRTDQSLRQGQVARAAAFAQEHGWPQLARQQMQIYQDLLRFKSITN